MPFPVSTATRSCALGDWGIVSRTPRPGDRKEYFQAEQDVWKLFRTILRERKKREIDPLIEALHACRRLTEPIAEPEQRRRIGHHFDSGAGVVEAHNARLDDMLEFVDMIDSITQRIIRPSGKGLKLAAKLFSRAS